MKVYHISDKKQNSISLTPRIPDNYMTKNGFEDKTTKRVCVSKTIDGALKAMSMNLKGKELHVYSLDVPDSDIYKPTSKDVPDAFITKELWIKKPITMKYEKTINVGEAKDKEYNYKYGDNVATLYGWNFTESFNPTKRDNTRISKIQNAGATQTMLAIKYKDKKGNLSERTVEPYKLQGNDFWGYDPLKDSIRRFKVKSIQSAKNTKKKYEPRWEIEMDGINMIKTSEYLDYLIEKVALSEDEIRDVYNKSFSKIKNKHIDNSKTKHDVRKTLSLPWNENYMIETYLRNGNGKLLTEKYFDQGGNEDDAAISRIRGKGSMFNKNKKVYTVIPDQIAVKEKFKRSGIGRDFVNSIEDVGLNIGADSMELYPDSQGVDVWTRPEFNFHVSNSDKKDFFKAYNGYRKDNGTERLKGETLISKYPSEFTSNYLKNNFGTTLRKALR